MLELSHLRCFVAVAEELHFGRAAARLNLTQPPLSRQIQALETMLGVKLLDRTSRSVRLTRAGQRFLLEARDLLRMAEGAALAARRTASGQAGSLTLGFTAASGYELLPRLIQHFRARAPDIDVVLKEMVSAHQIEALIAGRIDVGLVRPVFNRREFESLCVVREPLFLAMPDRHYLVNKPAISIADLDGHPIVTYSPYEARYFYDLVAALFAKAGVSPNYVQYISQIHSIIGLVKAGIGLALVPKAAKNLRFDGVTMLPITDTSKSIELHAIWRSSNTDMALETLQRTLKSLSS
ncbi:LysR family transcriptional regulator [Brucellaceae bacterium D45D]